VKLWQAWQLLQQLEEFALPRNLPLCICGDFNSSPNSSVYSLMSEANVHPGHPDLHVESDTNVLPQHRQLAHNFRLGSAYASVVGEEPEYTNYTEHFKGVLDYIWFTTEHMRPLSTAPIPAVDVLTQSGVALPNAIYSSDHILMLADIQLGGAATRQA
jgi:CCR4-NOT transcription complex subunit 6